ncbi:PAS domain S-box protein [Hymenobacter sp. BT730]|uniref:PAS domain S-box protein n=1 Tax=Hymenobacter sp. BT730 TaxID=3063332 RepID=UPI0026DFF41C|nr:PAS domain S-box protein [Hymenobacter sp. BT730]
MQKWDELPVNRRFEQSAAAVFMLNEDGNFRQCNARFTALLGLPTAQLAGTSFFQLLPPESAAYGRQCFERAAAGEMVHLETVLLGASPQKQSLHLFPLLADGQIRGVYGMASVGLEPPSAPLALQEREHQLSVIFDSIADVTFVLNVEPDGRYRFTFANKAFQRTTGLPPEKVIGSYVDAIIPEPSLSLVLAKYQEAVTTQKRVAWLETSDYPTGQVTGEVSVTPVLDEAGVCTQLVGVVHDLTDQKRTEEALRLSNERFQYVLRATTDAIYDWNIATDTIYWGEGLETSFGHQLEQNPSPFNIWLALVHPQDKDRVLNGKLWEVNHSTTTLWQDEYRFKQKNGSWAVVFDRGYIVRDATGKPERMIGSMQDITERKETEERQRLMADKLFKQNADLQQFAYIVSHNLRAPLANAIGYADLISRVEKDSPVFDESVKNLQTSMELLDEILTDVTSILSIRDKQGGYRPEPVALAAVCQQALLGLEEPLQESGGQIICDIPETLRVRGNRAYFHSIFHNLISNAIKYRSDERPLRIEIKAVDKPHEGTTITIADNGSGFNQKKAGEDVFQLYRRFHTDKRGRGIGLFLVKSHVESMGGQITVESRMNEGTRFILYFSHHADENLPD